MTAAARIVLCAARRIGYPDMEGRDPAGAGGPARRRRHASSNRARLIAAITEAAVPLALIDPGTARALLEQIEAEWSRTRSPSGTPASRG